MFWDPTPQTEKECDTRLDHNYGYIHWPANFFITGRNVMNIAARPGGQKDSVDQILHFEEGIQLYQSVDQRLSVPLMSWS